jgi:hypothetical protein
MLSSRPSSLLSRASHAICHHTLSLKSDGYRMVVPRRSDTYRMRVVVHRPRCVVYIGHTVYRSIVADAAMTRVTSSSVRPSLIKLVAGSSFPPQHLVLFLRMESL